MADEEEEEKKQDGKPDEKPAEGDEAAAESKKAETPEEKALTKEEEEQKKKNFRLFLMLALVNVLVLSGLFYSFNYVVKEPPKEEAQLPPPEEEFDDEEDELLEDSAYVFEPFLVNVIARHQGRARQGQKVLRVSFEVIPDLESTHELIDKNIPKLRDHINILLSSQDYGEMAMSEGRDELKAAIIETINEVIQPQKITTLYFTEFVIN